MVALVSACAVVPSVERLDPGTFRVRVERAGAYVSHRSLHAAFLRRCAEVTLENGCDYFVILDYDNYVAIRDSTSRSPSEVIRIYRGEVPSNAPGAFRARDVMAKEASGESSGA
jgi:hypothetical protein